jgi:hypothetical protein
MTIKALNAPHRGIPAADERERFALELFDGLWTRYRARVGYVQVYERVVEEAGAAFVNDHIAFRTFACQEPAVGIPTISRLFEALGYSAAACYAFPDKHLGSIHLQHPNPRFPKLFISELKTWELSPKTRSLIHKVIKRHRALLGDAFLAGLAGLDGRTPAAARAKLLKEADRFFGELPWDLPQRKDVLAADEDSQFAAWVLVHGYDVNHFTSSINSHGVPALDDIEKTVAALRRAGVPMKAAIEGERGSKLRQSATEAAPVQVWVRDGAKKSKLPWTYAYFELAERGDVVDPETGRRSRFEGFLGGQATQLFEMTKTAR